MSHAFGSEVLAIKALRAKYPSMGQTDLARRITLRNFAQGEDVLTAEKVGSRSYLSTYSVIRRYDAAQKAEYANV